MYISFLIPDFIGLVTGKLYSWSYCLKGLVLLCCCCSFGKSCPALCNPSTAACQASLSFTVSWSLLIELVMPSNHLLSVVPFCSCASSFSASGSFPMSWLFTSVGHNIGALASVLPVNIQDWLPLGLTGLISLLSMDSQEASPAPQF